MLTFSTQSHADEQNRGSETCFEHYNEFINLYENTINEADQTTNYPRFDNLNIDKFEYFTVEKFN